VSCLVLVYILIATIHGLIVCHQYLGPTATQLAVLFILATVNSLTCFMLSVLLIRTVWGLGGNVTTIESWEIARHSKLLCRARASGGYLDGPDGIKVRIERQEFPYDIGIWSNVKQGMGTGNVFLWLWPFAPTPKNSGLDFELNGFDESGQRWPPPDPDRIPRLHRTPDSRQTFFQQGDLLSDKEEMDAFHRRQRIDLSRRQGASGIFEDGSPHDRSASRWHDSQAVVGAVNVRNDDTDSQPGPGEEGWRSPEGDRLQDYGVDEDAEFYDQEEENVPLSELIQRRHGKGYRD
jgi:palmitoyltransferase